MTTATDDTRLGIMEGRLTEQSIAIQELRNDFREGQQQMNARFDEIATQFSGVNTRFGEINTRFGEVNTRFGEINTRFGEVSARFDEINVRFEQMNNRIHQLTLAVIGVGGTVAVAMLSFAGVLAFQLIQNG